MDKAHILGTGVEVHNLKKISFSFPKKRFIVVTGVSGSGKTSLAFDTIHVEGQRRYVYTLPPFVRSRLPNFTPPKVEMLEGITPSIAIDQNSLNLGGHSIVASQNGIYDLMRVLMEKCAIPRCPLSLEPLFPLTLGELKDKVLQWGKKRRVWILASCCLTGPGSTAENLLELEKSGILRLRIDDSVVTIQEAIGMPDKISNCVDVVIDRLDLSKTTDERLLETLKHALEVGQGLVTVVDYDTSEEKTFSEQGYSQESNTFYPALTWNDFSYTRVSSMCPVCEGRGEIEEFNCDSLIDSSKSLQEGVSPLLGKYSSVKWGNIYRNLAKIYDFSLDAPWQELSKEAKKVLLEGVEGWISMEFVHPKTLKKWNEYVKWKGFYSEIKKKYASVKSAKLKQEIESTFEKRTCPACKGSRVKPYPSAALLKNKTWLELCSMTIEEARVFFAEQSFDSLVEPLVERIKKRLYFCCELGLGYITLNRPIHSLSGGEAQRLRLSKALGSSLQEVTYILDEPSIGLHPHDHKRLLQAIRQLTAQNNTVIVVEHDLETIAEADYVVDLGPSGGTDGGSIVAMGTIKDVMKCSQSKIGQYLKGKWSLPEFIKKKESPKWLELFGATLHNVKKQDIRIPLKRFTAVSGVSGSGKSTLIQEVLYTALRVDSHSTFSSLKGQENVDRVVALGQKPIGRSSRSTLATYTGVWDEIRDIYALLPESKIRGYTASRFSFNSPEGICTRCKGLGLVETDPEEPDEECPDCKGKRYNEQTLSIEYNSCSVVDVLEMTVSEARVFFKAFANIHNNLSMLEDIGVGYLTLGQPSSTLSGGEAQRIKLAKALLNPSRGNTLYLLDEPSVGLHIYDIGKLLSLLHKLTDQGHTVVVIEHDTEILKRADYLIDLGPGPGERGGKVIYQGPPDKYKDDTPTSTFFKHEKTKPQKSLSTLPKAPQKILLEGCSEHNLKHLNLSFDHNAITLIRGPSGSGKSTLIMKTLYAHATREYRDSLPHAIQAFLPSVPLPKVDDIQGVSPPIAIDRHSHRFSRRSTCATLCELYEPLTKLFTQKGVAHCPETKEKLISVTPSTIANTLMEQQSGSKAYILAPITIESESHFYETVNQLQQKGYLRIRINKNFHTFDEKIAFIPSASYALVIDRLILKKEARSRILSAVEEAQSFSSSYIWVDCEGTLLKYNLAFSSPSTGISYPPLEPKLFSYNHYAGECPECRGLGSIDTTSILDDPEHQKKTVIGLFNSLTSGRVSVNAKRYFLDALKERGISFLSKISSLSQEELIFLYKGHEKFKGLAQWQPHNPDTMEVCPSCKGGRLNPYASAVTYKDHTLPELMKLKISALIKILKDSSSIIEKKLNWLNKLGLGELTLGQSSYELSEGKVQRILLAGHIQVNLTNALYLLDTPTNGLYQDQIPLIQNAISLLHDQSNTIIVIDNRPEMINLAHHVVELNEGAITYNGPAKDYSYTPPSLRKIKTKPTKKHLTINDEKLPLEQLTFLKPRPDKASFIQSLLKVANESDHFNKVVVFQSHSSFSSRSDIATYLDILTPLRQFFSTLPESQLRGLTPKHFSYNNRSGCCKKCRGLGKITHYFHYVPPTEVICDSCHGYRLNPQALSVIYKNKNISQHLQSSAQSNALPPLPKYQKTLDLLNKSGVGSIDFSTPLKNLSHGEWLKISFVKMLLTGNKTKTLYILDNPFSGMMSEEISPLMSILYKVSQNKNTIALWTTDQ